MINVEIVYFLGHISTFHQQSQGFDCLGACVDLRLKLVVFI